MKHLVDVEALAERFHEAYERLAPQHGYTTRPDSAVPWHRVPEQNRQLMIAVCAELAEQFVIVANLAATHRELADLRRLVIDERNEIMSALVNLQTADQALKDEVVVVLERLAGQVQGGLTEDEGNAIADDINAQVAALKAATDAPADGGGDEPAPVDGEPVEETPAA